MKSKICIVDDERTFATLLSQSLRSQGFDVETAFTAEKGLEKILGGNFDLVVLDLHLPDGSGLDVLKQIRGKRDDCDIIVATAYGSVEYAVKAMKLGAVDFITKPFKSDSLKLILDRLLQKKSLQKEISILKAVAQQSGDSKFVPGESESMNAVYEMALTLAQSASTSFLIQGETGVGKGYLAQFIHDNSPKSDRPLLQLNCAAVPDSLVESELFGYQAGAFTGAQKTKKGLLELADGGMFFLDEIGDLSSPAQAKLLQVLESKKFKRVGGLNDISMDIWIIAATNKDLDEEIEKGNFRSDLLYRLNVVTLQVPPLRSRKEDIPIYTLHFIGEFNKKLRKKVSGITETAMNMLNQYTWPGNLRELRNVIERAVLLTSDGAEISTQQLPDTRSFTTGTRHRKQDQDGAVSDFLQSGVDLKQYLTDLEKSIIDRALDQNNGNQSETARQLGVPKHVIKYRVQKSKKS